MNQVPSFLLKTYDIVNVWPYNVNLLVYRIIPAIKSSHGMKKEMALL